MIPPLRKLFILFAILFAFTACSKSDDQRRFEEEAFVEPQGITETSPDGQVLAEDPDDWRISPMYQGLITVQPVYPNSVDFNSNLILQIDLNVADAINYIGIYYFEFPTFDDVTGPIEELHQSTIGYYNLLTLPASNIRTGSSDTYRILVYDGNNNLITYGDVRIN